MRRPKPSSDARIEPLALLPVFHRLTEGVVLVAGGSDAAAWKAELLAAAGAKIALYAPEIDPVFAEIIARQPETFDHAPREWSPLDLVGKRLAVLDTDCDIEAAAFVEAGRMTGVPINVIDRPDFCQFQFGSIVNRSPAIVSISTDGAAPILGQAIRRKIEILLPKTLKDWAALAQKIRPQVNAAYDMGTPRRAFWERFVDRVFSGAPASTQGLFDPVVSNGRVTLVGAGPGDAELLTIKAMRALQRADVILFDDLVAPDVLELARREAKRMLVGKRGKRASCKQDDINALMLKLAKSGKSVVRLKAGDPMMFGRAGEEITFLQEHGIAVDVVPGVTAAAGMASALGVSLTHRDVAQSVRFVTGHSRNGTLPDTIDWAGVASRDTTTVFYMGGRTARLIRDKLVENGMPGTTPVSVMSSVSRPSARAWHGALDTLGSGIDEIGYEAPVLIGVGHVFAQARALEAGQDAGLESRATA